MKLNIIQYPYFFPLSDYNNAINKLVEKIKRQRGAVSIFQVGNISNPGISDIDILVVFDNEINCYLNPIKDLTTKEKYLFSHGLYGTSKSTFFKAKKYLFFHNYNLLWGQRLNSDVNDLHEDVIVKLKVQIALEYLIKAYINTSVELTYQIIKIRSFLLHTKALLYDLDFLGVSSGNLYDLLNEIVSKRNQWFENRPEKQHLEILVKEFYLELTRFLKNLLTSNEFFLPKWANLQITRNIKLVPSKNFGYKHKGVIPPPFFGDFGKKYFNILHGFNIFTFCFPIMSDKIPHFQNERFLFLKEVKYQNKSRLPYFNPLDSSLNIFDNIP